MGDLKKIMADLVSCGRKNASANLDYDDYTGETLEIHLTGGDVFGRESRIGFFIRALSLWDSRIVEPEIFIHDFIRDCAERKVPGYEHLTAGDDEGRAVLAGLLADKVTALMEENPEDFRITAREPREEISEDGYREWLDFIGAQ